MVKMQFSKSLLLFLVLISLLGLSLFSCSCGDDPSTSSGQTDDDSTDDDTDSDDDDDDSTGDDDDSFPFIAPVETLKWKRYSCNEMTKEGISVVTGNYNIHGGKEGTPQEIGQELAKYGPFDIFSLQECPEEYAEPIADEMGMYYFFNGGQSLMSTTPLIDPQSHSYVIAGRGHFLHANFEIGGYAFSAYGVHVNWDETGDVQNREMVDDYLSVDPVERIVLMGDWNEELGSTQAIILEEELADAWSSLGVTPSTRTSWPAIMFYGAEGQQLIDNSYFNKSSGGCAVDGEMIHLSPNLSDHKPQKSVIFFPESTGYNPPALVDVVYGLGPDSIGLLFDKPIETAQVELYLDGEGIETILQQPIGDGTLFLVKAKNNLPTENLFSARVIFAEDIDGAQITDPIDFEFPLYANLVKNGGAESADEGWTFSGVAQTDEINHVLPLLGDSFFAGIGGYPRADATQEISLDDFAEIIDVGHGWAAFGGTCKTGYRIVEGGSSNYLLPHDECEGMVEFLDGDGNLLKHVSGGRYDTMYWQPWRVTDSIPPKARTAKVILRSMAVEEPWAFNSASFDAIHFSVMAAENPHDFAGGNLIANSLFKNGKQDWNMSDGIIIAKDHWIPIRSNIDINSATGDYLLVALMITPGEKIISQKIPLIDFSQSIEKGKLSLEWGAYLRTWNPRSQIILKITFLDKGDKVIISDALDPINIPEWFKYSKTIQVPTKAVFVKMEWIASTQTPIISVAAFFDAPFIYPLVSD